MSITIRDVLKGARRASREILHALRAALTEAEVEELVARGYDRKLLEGFLSERASVVGAFKMPAYMARSGLTASSSPCTKQQLT